MGSNNENAIENFRIEKKGSVFPVGAQGMPPWTATFTSQVPIQGHHPSCDLARPSAISIHRSFPPIRRMSLSRKGKVQSNCFPGATEQHGLGSQQRCFMWFHNKQSAGSSHRQGLSRCLCAPEASREQKEAVFISDTEQPQKQYVLLASAPRQSELPLWPCAFPAPRLHAAELQREVLSDEMISVKQHYNVDLKLDFEVGSLQCGAGEQPREDHVNGDREAPADITIGNLNVLNFCGIASVAFCTPTGLHADQLQLDAPDGSIRVLHHQLARQWLCNCTVGGVEMASNEEFRKQCSLLDVL